MHPLEFRSRVERSWSPESAHPDSHFDDPANGQCAVTALLFYNHFGALILKSTVCTPDGGRHRHYWNVHEGMDIDLTWRQFPLGSTVDLAKLDYVDFRRLYKSVRDRYLILQDRFNQLS